MPKKGKGKGGGEQKERFLDLLLGKKVIIQSRHGIIYEGIF